MMVCQLFMHVNATAERLKKGICGPLLSGGARLPKDWRFTEGKAHKLRQPMSKADKCAEPWPPIDHGSAGFVT
jgi:hypothetical protein